MIHDQKYKLTPKTYKTSPNLWHSSESESFMNNGHRKTAILRTFSGTLMYAGILCQNMFFWNGGGKTFIKITFHAKIGRSRRKQFWKYGRIGDILYSIILWLITTSTFPLIIA